MTDINHLDLAREDWAIAESGDSKHEAWRRTADNIARHIEGTGDSQRLVATKLGKDKAKVNRLLKWREKDYPGETPWENAYPSDEKATTRAAQSHTKAVLRDPVQRKAVIDTLKPGELIDLRSVVEDRLDDEDAKVEARRAEHRDDDSISGIIGSGESLDDLTASITESWADEQIQRVHYTSDKLARHIQKWGLVLGSLTNEQALDLMERAEHDIAEIRAALQERVRDNSARSNA